jgi:hypothetical protein
VRRLHDVDRDAEADVARAIGGRNLDERDVDAHPAATEERGDLRQEDRGVVGEPGVDRVANVGADEQRVVPEPSREAGVGVGRDAEREDVQDLTLGDVLVLRERAHEHLRLGAAGADEDVVAGPHAAHGRGRGHEAIGLESTPATAAAARGGGAC